MKITLYPVPKTKKTSGEKKDPNFVEKEVRWLDALRRTPRRPRK